jgi:hypothetical protein
MKRIMLHELGWFPKNGKYQTARINRRDARCLRLYRMEGDPFIRIEYPTFDDMGYEIKTKTWSRADGLSAQAIIWAFQFDKMEELDAP